MSIESPVPMAGAAIIKPRGFMAATRLEMKTGELPASDRRKLLVDEIQELVGKVNKLLERRDGLFRTPKKLREQRFAEFSEEYAELMVTIEQKHQDLKDLEKKMKIPQLEQ